MPLFSGRPYICEQGFFCVPATSSTAAPTRTTVGTGGRSRRRPKLQPACKKAPTKKITYNVCPKCKTSSSTAKPKSTKKAAPKGKSATTVSRKKSKPTPATRKGKASTATKRKVTAKSAILRKQNKKQPPKKKNKRAPVASRGVGKAKPTESATTRRKRIAALERALADTQPVLATRARRKARSNLS